MAPKRSAYGAMSSHSQARTGLSVVVMAMVVVAVVMAVVLCGECGARTNQDQNRGEDKLLHAMKGSTV
jgi:archaellin